MASLLQRLQDTFNPRTLAATMPSSVPAAPAHPYYPLDIVIAGFVANEWNRLELCSMFAAGCAVIFAVTYIVATRLRPNVSTADLVTVLWFVLCRCCFFFEERRSGG